MITYKTPQEIALMREGGTKLAFIMQELIALVRPGVTTKQLDKAAESLIKKAGAKIAFRDYLGFPGVICTSVNEQVVHVVPSARVLQEGDILTLDIGLIWKDYYLDMARTVGVGVVSLQAKHLIETTKKSLRLALRKTRPGNTVGDIGNTVQRFVEDQGYQVVRDLCGHGIGKELHEDPKIANFGKRGKDEKLQEGMVICIEPMVTAGDWALKRMQDGHGFVTRDGKLACHFEDTIALTKNGCEVLTTL